MNKVLLSGRLTRDPDIRWTQGQDQRCIARFTLAVNRRTKEQKGADFISCIAFDKRAEWFEKYIKQGDKVEVTGKLNTGSYTNRDGRTIYTTDVVVEDAEFGESKKAQEKNTEDQAAAVPIDDGSGFMKIPDGAEETGLPFS